MENDIRLAQIRPNLTDLRKKAKERCDLVAKKMKMRFDRNRLGAKIYEKGDTVLVERTMFIKGLTSGKLVPKYIGPLRIIQVLGNDRYRVASFTKDRRRFKGIVASDRLRLFKPQKIEL
uniref:Retrotransposable element n=1 Tax=Anoplophora glabripennis TaxID=217634 RepID=V5GQJ9_ANOGL